MSVPSIDGITLLAKQSGISSFSSLWQVKNALGTKKIGHTGTLDTFAEGLLVVLSGRLTRLGSYITNCNKEYEALIRFGSETDTLDPDGTVVTRSPLPVFRTVLDRLPSFTGNLLQVPPSYSAVHVAGQRASDRIRKGEAVNLPPRPVTIHSLDLLSWESSAGFSRSDGSPVSSVVVRIVCSKGTYVRSLARDIGLACGSSAHVGSLRRTGIGPFRLSEAAGFSMLEPFGTVTPAVFGQGEKPPVVAADEIRASVRRFTPETAVSLGIPPVFLDPFFVSAFLSGQKPRISWFPSFSPEIPADFSRAVFCDTRFLGVVSFADNGPVYQFVSGQEI